jgi:hypothetical protein
MLLSSNDPILLEYARDEIGAGIRRTRYNGAIQNLRFQVLMRKNALARRAPPPPRTPRTMTTAELVKAVSTQRGPRLKVLLQELATRRGKEVLDGLSLGAASYDRDVQKLSRGLLDRHLGSQSAAAIKARLEDASAEVRCAAVRVLAARHPGHAGDLIDLVADDRAEVRAEVRAALVKLSGGTDFGPRPDADRAAREQARRQWRAWWDRSRAER